MSKPPTPKRTSSRLDRISMQSEPAVISHDFLSSNQPLSRRRKVSEDKTKDSDPSNTSNTIIANDVKPRNPIPPRPPSLVAPQRSEFASASVNMTPTRRTTLKRKNPSPNIAVPKQKGLLDASEPAKCCDPWLSFVSFVTCCCFSSCLKSFMPNPQVQQAWREKIALCVIIAICCAGLGFLTFGLQRTICENSGAQYPIEQVRGSPSRYILYGELVDMRVNSGASINAHKNFPDLVLSMQTSKAGGDISRFFPINPSTSSLCSGIVNKNYVAPPCTSSDFPGINYCHTSNTAKSLANSIKLGPVTYTWNYVFNGVSGKNLFVYKTKVLNMSLFLSSQSVYFPSEAQRLVRESLNEDGSILFGGNPYKKQIGDCLAELYTIGKIEGDTVGCFTNNLILYISLTIILSVVLVRFVLAIGFSWFLSRKLGKLQSNYKASKSTRKTILEDGIVPFPMFHRGEWNVGTPASPKSATAHTSLPNLPSPKFNKKGLLKAPKSQSDFGKEIHTILLVTCYSEGEEGLKATFDSLALTDYSEDYKLLFIVADGIITGSGNAKSTPELIIDMLEMDKSWPLPPPALSYFSLADGPREHNMAQVYTAWYNKDGRSIPTILVVKTGTDKESTTSKPGNRGKRDSQMLLMKFLEKVTFNQRMCPLEYELFQKMHYLMGVTPDKFEIVLMVDADTKVATDSLARMVACMAEDPTIMGLCGETRIGNKSDSWVTRIQVFEYFIAQNLTKAFESIFGNVTCLPGCFCMYRIKAPKGDGYWVPILVNPDIINTYSERFVDTLHKKNLLLLGEDRFLTTLMLRTFPRRKLIFVPSAYCKTVVPDKFSILLSQRRRWINSTIHNLLELVLVRELCGVFCFSMQSVIVLELIGTVTLPAAIVFTLLLIITSIIGEPQWIPLALLAAILGLPAVLILLTTRRVVYVYWMLLYLIALPIWNFVLPVYAFWHFDDFSWGQTRMVQGEGKDKGHGCTGGEQLKAGEIVLRRWAEWERERRIMFKRESMASQQLSKSPTASIPTASRRSTVGTVNDVISPRNSNFINDGF